VTPPVAGPPALGRGVLVTAGAPSPQAWADAPRLRVGEPELDAPAPLVEELHRCWAIRQPVVVELAVDPARFRDPQRVEEPPYALDARLDLPLDRLHHLLWTNNYDAREGEPIWWWARKAERAGCGPGREADVTLPGGGEAWIDGGPRWSVPALDRPVVHCGTIESGRADPVPAQPPGPQSELAADQLAAVAHPGGPVRVIAPAGSGKTRVLTERVRHLLADRGYERESLLAVAYNKEAQRELEARLFRLSPRTRTLNSLGYRLVADHRGARPPLLDEPEIRRLIGELFPVPRQRRTNTDPVGPYLDALTQVRLGLRPPAAVEADRDDVTGLADGFDRYRRALADRGAVDFDEQIYAALEALLADGPFRRLQQRAHRHLLVDEFQDLTPAHVLLIRLLAMPAFDVFGVGDDDQTIYDHAGADPRFLVDYADYFPGAGTAALHVNYRCARELVAGASRLLGYNRVRVEKRIEPGPAASADPDALRIEEHPGGEAAERVVELVSRWRREGTDAEEISVLARVNSLLLAPQIALWAAGVPLRASVREELLERTGMAAALAWLRLAVDPDGLIGADLDLVRRRPSRGFPGWISKWFGNCRSLADLEVVARRIDDQRVSTKVSEMAADMKMLVGEARAGADTRRLLELVRDRIGLGGAMEMLDGSKGTQATASHLDDLEALILLSDLHSEPSTFEPWLRASLAESAGSEGVTLSTVHRVKGREWDRVAVFGASAGIMPHRLSVDWEAERRVLHVAITRARRQSVVLSDSARRSPFLDELTGKADSPATAPERVVLPPGVGGPAKATRPVPAGGPDSPAAAEALRRWRSERSTVDRVPAYVVLSNRQLEGIAAAMPGGPRELLACDGIGPTRLERYGDEILATLDSVRSGSG
jgi:DNA helicase II / ATP-dependent DNA helicase PcrA